MDIPAFPTHGQADGDDPRNQILTGGMTLRDYFAAAALQGLLAAPEIARYTGKDLVEASYKYADAMLLERNKRND